MNLTYGSSGEDVKKLQTALNNSGYGLAVDGIYGAKTQAAVRDYQSKNGLSVDGIAGTQTQGKLYGTSTSTDASTSTGNAGSTGGTGTTGDATATAPTTPEPTGYKESDAVTQAKTMLEQQMAQKPGAYESKWQETLDQIMNKIQNREEFSYDLNGDALYQQYKDRYITQGQQAMMDTMGQAAALTGGYGNSYASTVGNQAYQSYLQGLNDKVPELYRLALDRYNQEGQDLYNQYALLGDRENQDYGRYRDALSDYNTDFDRFYNQYVTERNYDYGMYADDRNYQYQADRDAVADKQWQTEFDEAVRQFNFANGIGSGGAGGSGGGSGGSGGSGGGGGNGSGGGGYTSNPGYSSEQIKALQRAAGITADGIWGPQTAAAYEAGARPTGSTAGGVSIGSNPNYNPNVNTAKIEASIPTTAAGKQEAARLYGSVGAYVAARINSSGLSNAEKLYLMKKYNVTTADINAAKQKEAERSR